MDTTTPPETTVLVLCARKPGTSFASFKHHYETTHVPLVTRLVLQNDLRPLSYTRLYTDRSSSPSQFPFGGAETFEYDCITRVVFRDIQHRDKVFEEFARHVEEIGVDEERFLDRDMLRVVFVDGAVASVRRD